jgi:hypothetical protein
MLTCGSSEGQAFDDVSNRLNASISYDRHSKSASVLGYLVHSSSLRAANGHHLLRNADGSTAHSHSETINTSIDEVFSLGGSDN